MKNLHLDKPIAFIDLETTGLSTGSDRIVELTFLKVYPDGTEELKSKRINPGIPIPQAATEVHGITDEDVRDEPSFRQFARSLKDFLGDCDIGGFNIKKFDLPLLEAEFKRAGLKFSREGRRIVDVLAIFHKNEPRDLAAAYQKYCGKELEKAHTSHGDIRATAEILDSQLEYYPDLPRDVTELDEYCYPREPDWIDDEGKFVWSEDGAIFGFGQYKGKLLKEITHLNPGYLDWIAGGDFSDKVKTIVCDALAGRLPGPNIT